MRKLFSKMLRYMARINEGSHSFTCHPHVYSQNEWAILPLLHIRRASPHFSRYSFPVTIRVEDKPFRHVTSHPGQLSIDGWLPGYTPRCFACPKKVIYPCTKRIRHRELRRCAHAITATPNRQILLSQLSYTSVTGFVAPMPTGPANFRETFLKFFHGS